MIKKLKKLSLLAALLLMSAILSSPAVMGQEDNGKIILTKDKAVEMAINSNSGVKKLEIALNSLVRNFNKTKDLNDVIEKQLDMLEQYEELYDKYQNDLGEKYIKYAALSMQIPQIQKQISDIQSQIQNLSKDDPQYNEKLAELNEQLETLQEKLVGVQESIQAVISSEEIQKCEDEGMSQQEALEFSVMKEQIQAMFNTDKPTEKQKYDMLIKNKDMYLSIQSAIQSMKLQMKLVKKNIDIGVRNLYDTVLYLEDAYELQKASYDIKLRDFKDMEEKYNQSQISKLDLTNSKIELEQSKLQVENMERTLENTKLSLKQMCGINIKQDIEIKDDSLFDVNEEKPLEYDEYLKYALNNKEEILIAKIDLEDKKRIYDSADKYLSSKDSELIQLKQDYEESLIKYDEAVNKVRQDVQKLYMEMKNKKLALDAAEKNLDKVNESYSSLKQNYEQGFVPISTLRSMEIAVKSSKMNYEKAVRDYENALYSLNMK